MKFVAILRQESGCDYTIGCGINAVRFEAENSIKAASLLKNIIKENYSNDETKLKSVQYFEIKSEYAVDVDFWYKEFESESKKAELNKIAKKEIAEYERIKEKYKL